MTAAAAKLIAKLAIMPESHAHLPSADSPDGSGSLAAGTGRVRFPLVRWVLAPCTTWQARRLAADFGGGMDAKTAWVMARLARHPDEHGYVMAHLDDEHRTPD
ncbi:hypothetical protein [Streptomyces neyagawaensis]|nr:hypothetical protein [Streptomyces neyagawaensis]MCL6735928.1 hypothetical protein [Streptomyces neyagawaensis]MDE1686845.1 hypothetical protein [Streptomyces neyagawaensis]